MIRLVTFFFLVTFLCLFLSTDASVLKDTKKISYSNKLNKLNLKKIKSFQKVFEKGIFLKQNYNKNRKKVKSIEPKEDIKMDFAIFESLSIERVVCVMNHFIEQSTSEIFMIYYKEDGDLVVGYRGQCN